MLKIFLINFLRYLLKIFWILPLNRKTVVFISYGGKQYSCNPKYLFELMSIERDDLRYVWVLEQNVSFPPSGANVIIIRRNSLKYIFYSLTAVAYVTNDGLSAYLPFRSNQIIINTWHGGGAYKSSGLGGNSQLSRSDKYSIATMAKSLTWFVSSSHIFSKNMQKFYLLKENKILSIGMPRNDQFFNESKRTQIKNKVRQKLGVSDEYNIVLYTPTFRGSVGDSNQSSFEINLEALLLTLENRFGKPFKIVYRVHHSAARPVVNEDIIDGSDYSDSQHLLQAADVLISDYSSILWDFSLTLKPSFIFAPDLKKYQGQDRGFTSSINNWPFSIAENNQELMANITSFDQQGYNTSVQQHHNDLGSYEKGTATVALFNKIDKALYVN